MIHLLYDELSNCCFFVVHQQYFDMVRDVGSANHCRTTLVPTSKSMSDEMRSSLIQASAAEKNN